MELNKQTLKKMRGLIVFTVVLLIALWKYTVVLGMLSFLLGIIFPFLLGGAIAFIMNVPMHFLEEKLFGSSKRKQKKLAQNLARPCCLILTILFVLGILSVVIFVVVPELGNTFSSLGRSIQEFIPKAQHWCMELFSNNKEIMVWVNSIEIDWENILKGIVNFFKLGAGSVLDSTFAVAKGIASAMTTFVIAFVFACYLLLQKERLNVQVRKVLYAYAPQKRAKRALSICSLTYKTFSSFLTGQCVEAVILGTLFFIAMSIFKIPYALLVGVLISFTALIPIFGAFIGCIVGAFLILMVDPVKALIFIIMFLILQQLEGNLIYPRVVGNSVGLPSIWVLAAVSVGGSLMGILGMLIFIPIVSVIYTLLRENVHKQLERKQIKVE